MGRPGGRSAAGAREVQGLRCLPRPLGLSNAPDAPHLAGQPRIYLVEQLKAFRDGRRRHEVMNVIAKPLTDADIADLAEWYASIGVEVTRKP